MYSDSFVQLCIWSLHLYIYNIVCKNLIQLRKSSHSYDFSISISVQLKEKKNIFFNQLFRIWKLAPQNNFLNIKLLNDKRVFLKEKFISFFIFQCLKYFFVAVSQIFFSFLARFVQYIMNPILSFSLKL